jgi:hypothetical protein
MTTLLLKVFADPIPSLPRKVAAIEGHGVAVAWIVPRVTAMNDFAGTDTAPDDWVGSKPADRARAVTSCTTASL